VTRFDLSLMLVLVIVSVFACGFAAAQAPPPLPPEVYAANHPFALATATTTRLFGMGGFVTCIPDAGFGNPAFAGSLTDTTAVLRTSTTTFDSGLKLTGEQASVAIPLKDNKRGIQITGFRLRTDNRLPLAGGPPPMSLGFSEYDMAFHYGQRLSQKWLVGVGVSPVFHTSVNLTIVGGPTVLSYTSSSDRGCRVGTVYDLSSKARLGAVYDRYDEDVTTPGGTLGFTSEELVAGLAYQVHPCLLMAAEWQQLTTEGTGTRNGDSGWRVGLEAMLDNNVTIRGGSNDGSLSLGLGLRGDRWNLNYAFIDDWNKDLTPALFGGSSTHQLEANYRF
jgi:hypothetical protein